MDANSSDDEVDSALLNGHSNSEAELEEGGRTGNIDINDNGPRHAKKAGPPVGSRYWYPAIRYSSIFAACIFVDAAIAIILWLTGRFYYFKEERINLAHPFETIASCLGVICVDPV